MHTEENTEWDNFRVIGKNITYLTILQVFNYVLPLITLPYLVRVLGADGFGYVSFAVSFAAYFLFVTEYGFNTVATKEISVNRNDKELTNGIFVSVVIIKLFLFLACLPVYLFIASFLGYSGFSMSVYYISYITILGFALFPAWYFKGREEMKYITVINFIARSLTVLMIFLLVKDSSDYIVYALILSLGFLFIGVSGFIAALYRYRLKLFFPGREMISHMLKDGFYMFLSNVFIGIYNNSNSFLLGLFSDLSAVGFYSAAYKIVNAASSFVYIVSESMFPGISLMFSRDRTKAPLKIRKYFYLSTLTGFIISAVLFIFAELIVLILLGENFRSAVPVLRILSLIPLTVSAGVIFGVQGLVGTGHYREFLYIMSAGTAIYLLLSFILIPLHSGTGASVSILATEIAVAVMAYYMYRKKILNA